MKNLKYLDRPLLIVTTLLFIFGLIMVFSASNVTAFNSGVSPYYYFLRQGLFLGLGLFAFLIIVNMKTKTYGFFSSLGVIASIFALIALLIIDKQTNQASSWIYLGPISIQPSEFAKVFTISYLACYYDARNKKLDDNFIVYFPIGVSMIIAALIYLQPDLGTMTIYAGIVGIMFLAQRIKLEYKVKIVGVVLGLVIVVGLFLASSGKDILASRQKSRFDYQNPCSKLLTTGNQVCNGYIAMHNGGLTGVGLGNSKQKYLYLPVPYSDFIFAIVVEELGLITGIFIILVYGFVLYRILKIGSSSVNMKGKSICYGVSIYIFIHIIVNLMGLLGLIPLTGVPLPFLSYGGSFTICLIIALSMVQRIAIEAKKARK